MAISSFTNLPGAGIDRIGGQADEAPNRVGRNDGVNHQPLTLQWPDGVLHVQPGPDPWPPQQAQDEATEADRRRALYDAIEQRKAAQAALSLASEAYQSASQHRADAQRHAASYLGLQDELNIATVEQLRGSRGKPDLSMFEARIADRTKADMVLVAASESEVALRREMADATRTVQDTEHKVWDATRLLLQATRADLLAEAQRLSRKAEAFSQISNAAQTDWPWNVVVEKLMLDPLGASLTDFVVPDQPHPVPPPAPAWVPSSGKVTIMNPDGTRGEVVDEGEFHQRMKQVIPDGLPAWQAEEAARQAARKAAGG
jgi:hypothetical protein